MLSVNDDGIGDAVEVLQGLIEHGILEIKEIKFHKVEHTSVDVYNGRCVMRVHDKYLPTHLELHDIMVTRVVHLFLRNMYS